MLESFCSLRKFSYCYSSWIQHLTKDILITKFTKATKGLDICDPKINFVLFVALVV